MRCGLIPALVAPLSAAAGASDFTGDLFHADDELSALGDGRSQLDVVETIVARFRDFDQNRGDRRGDAPGTRRGRPPDGGQRCRGRVSEPERAGDDPDDPVDDNL